MITLRHITFGGTLLEEWSAGRRRLYLLNTLTTHKRQKSMLPAKIEPEVPACERLRPRGHRDRPVYSNAIITYKLIAIACFCTSFPLTLVKTALYLLTAPSTIHSSRQIGGSQHKRNRFVYHLYPIIIIIIINYYYYYY